MLCQAAMLIFFLLQPCPNTANASKKRCASTMFFYAISLAFSQWQSLPAVGYFFMLSSFGRSTAEPIGNKVKEQPQKCESKGIAASHRTKATKRQQP